MDLLKSHKSRSRLSELAYVALNLGLAVALLFVVLAVQSPWLAIALVLVGKWRVLAVRPRFWLANILANMVDIIVSVSVVFLLYAASGVLWLQIAITILHVIWLLFIKPRSSRRFVAIQAGVAVFVGITALSIVSHNWDSALFVLSMWFIGYIAARHMLGSYEEPMTSIYSLIVGLLFAEIGWIGFHWLFAYEIPGFGNILLSQLAIIVTLGCFVAERSYSSYQEYGRVRSQDVVLPMLLALGIILTLVIFFNQINPTSLLG